MTDAHTPYTDLPPSAFWRTAVTGREADEIADIHRPKFAVEPTTKIAMAGSCFAQRLSQHLRMRGYSVLDHEPPPPGLTPEEEKQYGFGLYSAPCGAEDMLWYERQRRRGAAAAGDPRTSTAR